MRSIVAKIALLIFMLSLLCSCVWILTGPLPRPRAHYAVWVGGHWGPHGYWVPGYWATR
jgi:hypothetical protein